MKLIFHLLQVVILSATVSVAQTGTWTSFKHMPTARQEMPCALLNGKIYVSGGIIIASTNKTEVYDPATDSWSLGTPMPDSRHHHMMASANGKIYAIGGYKSVISFDARDDVWEYDELSNSWAAKSPIPVKNGAGAAVAFEDNIYVFGGDNNDGVLNNTYRYDPHTDEWEELAPLPTAREHLAAAVLNNKIYVVGGRGSFDAGVAVEVYTPATNTWEQVRTLPTPRSGLAAAGLNGRLYVLGGEGGGIHAENEEYDPLTNSWRSVEPMPTPRHGFTACVLNNLIYMPGGGMFEGFGPSNVLEAFSMEVISGLFEEQTNILTHHYAFANIAGNIDIHFELEEAVEMTISIMTLDGKIHFLNSPKTYPAGSCKERIPSKLSSGLLYYILKGNDFIVSGRVFHHSSGN